MKVYWSQNTFNYLDPLDNKTKLQVRSIFHSKISCNPKRFPKREIEGEIVRLCMLTPLPFVVIFKLDIPNRTCNVLRVFHNRQIIRL